jgi:hypothetical protein
MLHPITIAAGLALAAAARGTDDPQELGAVEWGRALEPALAESARSERPVLLLFQEIPG